MEEERDAVISKLNGARKLDKDGQDVLTYYRATVRSRRRDRSEYEVIVTCLLNMGPINGSAAAVAAVNRWKPRYVLLVGIACGVRGEVNHGDVIVASQVADYTLGKQQDGVRKIRWEVFPCGASLLDSANNIAANWDRQIGVKRPGKGSVRRIKGVVASGGDVISDDQVIAMYSDSWPKLAGIEMEAGGVAAGVHQTPERPEFLMIKGVSDFGKDKHEPDVKLWRPYACHAAAAFTVNLIKSGPARSLSELVERSEAASAEDEQRRAAERRWQYIQSHPIENLEILFILKGSVGFNWLRDVLDDTRLTFSRDDKSFKVGQVIAAAPPPNTKERSRKLDGPVCSFWEIYEPEPGYWVRKIAPAKREFSVVAGFDAVVPWDMLGINRVEKLEDLALLNEFGVSIPAQAYLVGVEEVSLTFTGETFSFSIDLSDHGLEFLHEMASVQHKVMTGGKPIPIGSTFSGVQLLDLFLHQVLPRPKEKRSKHGIGMLGLSGPGGKAIMFYPTMPPGFNRTPESNEYTFTITKPPEFDSAGRIKELESELVSRSTDAALYFELATGYLYEGRLQDVLRCLSTAIQKAPPSANVHGLMGQTLRKLGRYEEALGHCLKAAILAPEDARIQTEVGICLSELGRTAEKLVHFESAARLAPETPGYQINLAMALISLDRSADAVVPVRRAVELEPKNYKSAMLLGILLAKDGSSDEAMSLLERATELAPDVAETHQQVGTHLAARGQHEKAVSSFRRALELEASARLHELLGASYAALGQWEETEASFRQAVEMEPDDCGMLMNLGVALVHLDKLVEAMKMFEEALRQDPGNERAQGMLTELRDGLA